MRLLSYNIHKGIGGVDRKYDLERIIAVIAAENPDFICLQEVDKQARRSKLHDQGAMLAERFGLAAHMQQINVHLKRGCYGNLLLSRWPFHSKHQVSLRLQRKKPRGAQLAVIESPLGLFHLVNWHLGLAERERHWQVAHLLEHRLFAEGARHPTLIVGDFNDWRNTLARGPFRQHGFHQITTPIFRFRSFPAFAALGPLDKAFQRGLLIQKAHIVRTPAAKRASDHLPLVIDFEVAPSAPAESPT